MARRRLTRCLYWLAFLPLVLRFSVCFVLLFCFSFFSYTSPPPLPHPLICLPPPYASRREPSASAAEPPCHVTASVRHHGRAASTKAAVFALPKSAFASAAEVTRRDSASLLFAFRLRIEEKGLSVSSLLGQTQPAGQRLSSLLDHTPQLPPPFVFPRPAIDHRHVCIAATRAFLALFSSPSRLT